MRITDYITEINGHELLLRNAEEKDAELLLEYLKITSGETRFLVREPEEITMTLEEERDFIKAQNESSSNLMLLGFLDGKHVGNCSFFGNVQSRYQHRANMAIALYKKYTGMGIGTVMLNKLIGAAKEAGLEQMELEVVADNEKAIGLYRKMGFEVYGKFPSKMKYKDGTYADMYWMMKKLG